jgi:hypothetical protein
MINIKQFITDDDLSHYRGMSNSAIKDMIDSLDINIDGRKLYGIPDGDIDALLGQFRENDFTSYDRKKDWHFGWVNVLNNDGNIIPYKTRSAGFRFINKWNQESNITNYQFIIDNNNKILWLGLCKNKQYFISTGEKIYEIDYEHKDLYLFPDITTGNDYFDENDNKQNDRIIRKYRKNIGTYTFTTIDKVKSIFGERKTGAAISLDEHFPKGFFYKGLKWNKNWKDYHGYKYITILISITVKDSFFYIEIENLTYPFYGYILLDLNELKFIDNNS